MALDLYSPCPCGSGKKFKWCCQPIHVEIDKAFRQDAEGQHEAALRVMDEVTSLHPTNPEAWGRKAQLLYQNNKVDEAEAALQKAFEANPSYPFGHLLRGLFRQEEGEINGALLLFRKAAEVYDPEAKDTLAQVYSLIAEAELKLNRPLAAHAALKISARLRPSEEVQQGLEAIYGEKSRLPAVARHEYTFLSAPKTAAGDRGELDRALAEAATGKLGDAAKAFDRLTSARPDDAAAWYNLGLARAWLGDNAKAVEAFDRYVSLEPDEGRAAKAWALAEVLRFGQGMEDQSDIVEHSVAFEIQDPQRLFDMLQEWQRERRLAGVQVREEEGMISGVVLDQRTGLVTAGAGPSQPAKIGAYLLILGNLLMLRSSNSESLDRARRSLQESAGPSLSPGRPHRGPSSFGEVLADALVIPVGVTDQAEAERQVRDHVQRYFEDTWIHRPLRSLSGTAPIDAAGQPTLRKKLLGVVQFLQDCAAGPAQAYDFDRLRRKLGILGGEAPASPAAAAETAPAINAMGAAELSALQPDALAPEQLDEAWRTAQKLDAHELAGRFARAIIARPPAPGQADRYPSFNYLIQRALLDKNTDAALDLVNAGEKADCEQNEGRRRNDYELRRAQVLSKRGEADSARDVFERLIERDPGELKYRGSAAESMLSLKQGASALQFAEQGLAKAREKNDRDSEQYFLELVSAARKQVG
ncbi:MAG TPA: tetratricopeptide repeat protein [Gemmataceae bacterium]|nr:tetratricopeptide repeat protein [Gemmataceae bacterium]